MFTQWKIQGRRLFGNKMDGVVEAAHYHGEELAWVRAYERRGPTWSDHVLLNRESLLERLQDGKKFYIGSRVKNEASEFETGKQLVLRNNAIVTEDIKSADKDSLEDLPRI